MSASGREITTLDFDDFADRDSVWCRRLVNATFILCFFPSLLYFAFRSETQPLAALPALFLLFLRPIKIDRLSVPAMTLLVVLIGYSLYSLVRSSSEAGAILLNGGSYAAPVIVFLALYDKLHLVSVRMFRIALWAWFIIGSVQFLHLLPGPLMGLVEDVGKLLITPRFYMITPADSVRGVNFFTPEPAYAAPMVILLGYTAVYLRQIGRITSKQQWGALAICGAMCVYNLSGTMAFLVLLTGVGAGLWWISRRPLKALAVVLLVGVAAFAWLNTVQSEQSAKPDKQVRVMQVVSITADMINGNAGLRPMTALVIIGGQRLIPMLVCYASLLDNDGLGHGIASWTNTGTMNHLKDFAGLSQNDYADYLSFELWKIVNDNPHSLAAALVVDTGLFGIIPFIAIIIGAAIRRNDSSSALTVSMLVVAVIWLLVFPPITLAVPWLLIAYSVDLRCRRRPCAQAQSGRPLIA
jgi:hypothetical protein